MQVRAWMVDDAVDRGDCMDARRPEYRGGRSAHSPDGHGRVRELVAGDPTTAVREAPREFIGDDGSGTDSDGGGGGGEVVVIPGHARPTAAYMHKRTHGARSNVEYYGRDQRVSRRQWRRQHEDAGGTDGGGTPCSQAPAISTTGSVSVCFPSVASVPTPTPGGARRSARHGAPRGASEAASPPPSLRYGAGAGTAAAGSPAPLPSASPMRRIFGDGDDVGCGSEADVLSPPTSHAAAAAVAARPSPSPSPSPFRTLETENEHLLSMVQVLTRHVADLTGHVARQSQEVRRLRSSSPSLPPQGAAAAASPSGARHRTSGQDRRMSPELTNEVPPPFTRNSRW